MKIKLSRKQVEEKIENFFPKIAGKTPEEIRKMKRLAMHHKIKLKEKKKLFCKYCYSNKLKVKSIKKGVKSVECEDCKKVRRWRVISRDKSK
jgi:RNase P subunit RPR2